MTQAAFYFDARTCIGCKACELACKEKNHLPGGISWRRVYDYGGGEWKQEGDYLLPDGVFTYHVSAACMHCQTPTCVAACGDHALVKQADGLVLIDSDKCTGCRRCEPACPYEAIHFDTQRNIATKCDFCADLRAVGEKPACVAICPQRCLDAGDLDELRGKYGTLDTINPLPDGALTRPAVVIVPYQGHQVDIDGGKVLNRHEKNRGSAARVSWRWDCSYDPLLPANPDWAATLEGEALLLRLLAKGFHDYADRKWLQSVIDHQLFSDVPFAAAQSDVKTGLARLANWCAQNGPGITEAHHEALLVDYTQLFSISFGGAHTPPWESVYCSENQLLFQEQTLQVRSWYQRYGLKYQKRHQEPEDHIALEFYFVGHLAMLAQKELVFGNGDRFHELINAQREFLSEHLFRWGHHWCDKVIDHAKTELLRGLAYLARGALSELAQVLVMKLPRKFADPHKKPGGSRFAGSTAAPAS